MVIATSITQDYLKQSQPLFDSGVKNWRGRRICFTIGFKEDIEGWETIYVPATECNWKPSNRKDYQSLQHGEWVNYLNLPLNEMVLFVDSDMELQRPFDLDMPHTDKICVTACSWPQLHLYEVIKNIGGDSKKMADGYKAFIQREFCGCFILTSVKTWLTIYANCKSLYPMLKHFNHHAAWQLLINVAVSGMRMTMLPEFVCNAVWYNGTKAKIMEGNLLVEDEKVYFNHTKFNNYAKLGNGN